MKTNSALCSKVTGSSKEEIHRIYERYEDYLCLVKEWKHLDIFDEVDGFVFQLVENYLETIENILGDSYLHLNRQLKKYEETIVSL